MASPTDEHWSWPDPGPAPRDGRGSITAGVMLLPLAGLAGWGVAATQSDDARIGFAVAGSAVGLISVACLGTGIYRKRRLKRWALAHHVVAQRQGSGLLVAGGMITGLGLAAVATGIALFFPPGGQPPVADVGVPLIGAGIAASSVIGPLMMSIGNERRQTYLRTGGWVRPSVMLTPTSVGVAFSGQF
jgi:hypothetical protein